MNSEKHNFGISENDILVARKTLIDMRWNSGFMEKQCMPKENVIAMCEMVEKIQRCFLHVIYNDGNIKSDLIF